MQPRDDADTEATPERDEPEQQPDPGAAAPAEPELQLPTIPAGGERKSGGRGGCQTWGCIVGILLLVPLLFVGYLSMKQTVWVGFDKRCEKLLTHLTQEMPAADREDFEASLQRMARELRSRSDPYPLMGEFSNRATAVLGDSRVSVREARQLSAWINAVLDGDIDIDDDPPQP